LLILQWRARAVPKALLWTAVALALIASASLGLTANFGGEIRHSEIRALGTAAD
jgi:hypothetical protein